MNNNNNNVNAAGCEDIENYPIGDRRTKTTKNGAVRTDNDVSILPRVRRFKLVPAASGMAKIEGKRKWNTQFAILVKVDGRDGYIHAARLATEFGMHLPNTYQTIDKARAAALRMKTTWGEEKARKAKKAPAPKKAELQAALEAAQAEIAALKAAAAAPSQAALAAAAAA